MKKYGKEWRIRAKVASIKCIFLYSMPDSSLRVRLCFFLPSSFRICPPLKNDGKVVFVLPWRSGLCTQTCPYRLAKLGTSLRVRGKLTLRKKAIKFYKSINWSNEYTKNRIGNASCPRLSGKVSAKLTKGVRVSKHVKRFLTKRY